MVGVYLEWENWAYGYLMLPAYIILYALIVNFFVFRIGILRHRKQYGKALGLIHKLSNGPPSVRKTAICMQWLRPVYFMTENDEAMTQELALIIDKRWQFDRLWLSHIVSHFSKGRSACSRTTCTTVCPSRQGGRCRLRTKQQLELLLKIIDPAEQERRSEKHTGMSCNYKQ